MPEGTTGTRFLREHQRDEDRQREVSLLRIASAFAAATWPGALFGYLNHVPIPPGLLFGLPAFAIYSFALSQLMARSRWYSPWISTPSTC